MKKCFFILVLSLFLVGCANQHYQPTYYDPYKMKCLDDNFNRVISSNIESFYARYNYDIDGFYVEGNSANIISYSFEEKAVYFSVEFLECDCHFTLHLITSDPIKREVIFVKYYSYNSKDHTYVIDMNPPKEKVRKKYNFPHFNEIYRSNHIINMVILAFINMPFAAIYFGLYAYEYLT